MFEIKLYNNVVFDIIIVEQKKFSAGELFINLIIGSQYLETSHIRRSSIVVIEWKYQSDEEMFVLLNIVRTLRQCGVKRIELKVPYFPHSRMDRVMADHIPFSLKTVIDVINMCDFYIVTTLDIHSGIPEALFADKTNFINNNQTECVNNFFNTSMEPVAPIDVLVSPDAGATKKIFDIAAEYRIDKVITASKNRDVLTGDITSTTFAPIYLEESDDIWVIDDICDGGRTFIELAKVLKKEYPNNKLYLFTTHGIYSKGIQLLEDQYDGVYCLNDMSKW